jgi:hypothetical protein
MSTSDPIAMHLANPLSGASAGMGQGAGQAQPSSTTVNVAPAHGGALTSATTPPEPSQTDLGNVVALGLVAMVVIGALMALWRQFRAASETRQTARQDETSGGGVGVAQDQAHVAGWFAAGVAAIWAAITWRTADHQGESFGSSAFWDDSGPCQQNQNPQASLADAGMAAPAIEIQQINPASGLPMVGGTGGLDVAGNPYGVGTQGFGDGDRHHSESLGHDWSSPNSSHDGWGSSWSDHGSSSFDWGSNSSSGLWN